MSIFAELGIQEGKNRIKEEVLYNLAACYILAERKIDRVLGDFGLSAVKINAICTRNRMPGFFMLCSRASCYAITCFNF